jgi:hypothetical protein
MSTKLLAAVVLCVFPALGGVITFDDLPGSNQPLPAGYAGFNWSADISYVDDAYYQSFYGNTYPFPSSPNAAYNVYGVESATMSGSAFTFNGAYFTGWASSDTAQSYTSSTIRVDGYLGGSFVGSVSTALPANSFIWLPANMTVDTLEFHASSADTWWLMDNLTYNEGVPEPGSLALLISGLTLLALRRSPRRS